ncbi:TonB-dependent receptor [Janthinobacterium fluminis]|uniref:TonB-dependent receptor n=1 Tax=Janthinobacterium fluminis TaxID=2987524 RepID=A0ABT5JX00_9BURK|nr:TonB-dependent receptor [Janthinobacterium fluminis]MDC8757268.1 TonB-dependent receptor [Janthinobacterium fluminis]
METVIARSVRLFCAGGAAALLTLPALAQDAPIQRVEITGSSIKRASAETASPVQVIGRDDLLKSGKASVAEYLQTLTVDGAGSLPTGFGNGFAAGSTAISLRGLGATSTLVLLNGRRMAPFARADDGQKSFTDMSTVPMQIVERIEILKDGASSTYGADAIAGVVNIILRKDFEGMLLKADTGLSGEGDAKQHKVSFSFGKGNLDSDKFNVVFNAEYAKSDMLFNKDRAGRAWIGKGDLRAYGYPIGTQFGLGYINGNNDATASPAGSIRNPTTLDYVSLPGCAALSTSAPPDPKGGCVWHQDQFRAMQPKIESINLYTRGTLQLNADTQLYAELGYSKRDTAFTLVPPSITPTVAFPSSAANPAGVINYGSGAGTAILLAANHPQNPYGVPVRVRYSAFDVGASTRKANNEFNRFVIGARGSFAGWDYDSAYVHSESKLHLDYSNMLNLNVVKAALGDPTSKYFPYYIGAEAGKNPASLYAAMARSLRSDSKTKLDIIDIKASRELFALPGGTMGLAVGAEHRREKLDNPSLDGTSDGSVNSNYVAAKGDSKVSAVYAEVLAPLVKTVELSAALRYDKYQNFNSTTPKLGAKWTPLKNFALRGTYSKGFRAPGPAESGTASQSTGAAPTVDPVRCPDGKTPLPGATSTDCNITINAVKLGNPDLKPETSKGYTLGLVWDPFDDTSVSLDAWKIKRSNEINPLPYNEAAALPNAIRADNNLTINGVVTPNTGTLLLAKAPYRNSSFTEIKGIDLDVKQRLRLGEYGRATIGLTWTHIASWLRAESDTVRYQFAGTHGNCDTSNCAGTPKDKINLVTSWDKADWNVTATLNYRSDMKNIKFEGAKCATVLANGSDAPNGCSIASFTTLDLSARWNYSKALQLFASVANVTDKIAPLDPLTYGGMSYNPMDASGAIGRYFKVGASYRFN